MTQFIYVQQSVLNGSEVVRVVKEDVRRYMGDLPQCGCKQNCCHQCMSTCLCTVRTLLGMCCYYGPPPGLFPCRSRYVHRSLERLERAVIAGTWRVDLEIHSESVRMIYRLMDVDMPSSLERLMDVPASIMHAPNWTGCKGEGLPPPRMTMLTSATGQVLDTIQEHPIVTAERKQTSAYQCFSIDAHRHNHAELSITFEVDEVNELDDAENEVTLDEPSVGHVMDPTHIELSYKEVQKEAEAEKEARRREEQELKEQMQEL